jgi:hypothetical protein
MRSCVKCSNIIEETFIYDEEVRKTPKDRVYCYACNPFVPRTTVSYTDRINERNKKDKNKKLKLKHKCIEYKGGSCIKCGYNKNSSALEFHHLDRNYKDFSISELRRKPFEDIKRELDKCILLCANCHREEHYPHANLY